MTTLVTTRDIRQCLRPFQASNDLMDIASIIEQCFADTMGSDRGYIRQLRMVASSPQMLRMATHGILHSPVPTAGFVWEEKGKIVGNASLILFRKHYQRVYLIANVAVLPEHRRRGIGRALMQACITYARQHSSQPPWLQVRAENASAIALYRNLGFVTRASRNTWHSTGEKKAIRIPDGMKITSRKSSDWSLQRRWFLQTYPEHLQWLLPIDVSAQQPGPLGWLHRLWNGVFIRQWSLRFHGKLLGVLTWQAGAGLHSYLWLSMPLHYEHLGLPALLSFATQHFPGHHRLALDYPSDRGTEIIPQHGFRHHQTLLWMQLRS